MLIAYLPEHIAPKFPKRPRGRAMVRKKGGGHGGGHGWYVTFADLMALLMSFFVMVAAYSTQDQKKLQLVAGSMRDAFGVKQGDAATPASSSRTASRPRPG